MTDGSFPHNTCKTAIDWILEDPNRVCLIWSIYLYFLTLNYRTDDCACHFAVKEAQAAGLTSIVVPVDYDSLIHQIGNMNSANIEVKPVLEYVIHYAHLFVFVLVIKIGRDVVGIA